MASAAVETELDKLCEAYVAEKKKTAGWLESKARDIWEAHVYFLRMFAEESIYAARDAICTSNNVRDARKFHRRVNKAHYRQFCFSITKSENRDDLRISKFSAKRYLEGRAKFRKSYTGPASNAAWPPTAKEAEELAAPAAALSSPLPQAQALRQPAQEVPPPPPRAVRSAEPAATQSSPPQPPPPQRQAASQHSSAARRPLPNAAPQRQTQLPPPAPATTAATRQLASVPAPQPLLAAPELRAMLQLQAPQQPVPDSERPMPALPQPVRALAPQAKAAPPLAAPRLQIGAAPTLAAEATATLLAIPMMPPAKSAAAPAPRPVPSAQATLLAIPAVQRAAAPQPVLPPMLPQQSAIVALAPNQAIPHDEIKLVDPVFQTLQDIPQLSYDTRLAVCDVISQADKTSAHYAALRAEVASTLRKFANFYIAYYFHHMRNMTCERYVETLYTVKSSSTPSYKAQLTTCLKALGIPKMHAGQQSIQIILQIEVLGRMIACSACGIRDDMFQFGTALQTKYWDYDKYHPSAARPAAQPEGRKRDADAPEAESGPAQKRLRIAAENGVNGNGAQARVLVPAPRAREAAVAVVESDADIEQLVRDSNREVRPFENADGADAVAAAGMEAAADADGSMWAYVDDSDDSDVDTVDNDDGVDEGDDRGFDD